MWHRTWKYRLPASRSDRWLVSIRRWTPPKSSTPLGRTAPGLEHARRHNAFFLCNARCVFRFTNDPTFGTVHFTFHGTVLTDVEDRRTIGSDLRIELQSETCPWLTADAVAWLKESVDRAVRVEFDQYIAAGDLQRTVDRLRDLEGEITAKEGYLGMGL